LSAHFYQSGHLMLFRAEIKIIKNNPKVLAESVTFGQIACIIKNVSPVKLA